MARIHTTGFESGRSGTSTYDGESNNVGTSNGQCDHASVGTVTYQSTVARNSGFSAECIPNAANYTQVTGMTHTVDVPMYARFYVRINATPTEDVPFFQWRISGAVAGDVVILSDRTVRLRDASTAAVGSDAPALAINTWYMIESKITIPAAGNGALELKINGAVTATSSSVDVNNALTTSSHRLGHIDASESAMTVYIDDVAFNEGSGGDNTGYPGHGNVTLLKPTADNAVGTGWEGPQTTGSDTTNLYDNVDNVPPTGVAHSDTDANAGKYLFNAANLGAASEYRATCQTPTAAGVPSNASFILSQAYMRASCDSTTGTNNMELQGITPSDSAVTCNVEVTAIAGTEPTGWKSFRTVYANAPAITISTAPVVEAAKIATGVTRAHMVDQMGLMIEWKTPLTATIGQATETDIPQAVIARKTTDFPTEGLLDDFEYTESPISDGGVWDGPIDSDDGGAGAVASSVWNPNSGATGSSYRTDINDEDLEVWGTLGAVLINTLRLRVTDQETSTPSFYLLVVTGTTLQLTKIISGTQTVLSTISIANAADDKVGIRIVGDLLTGYKQIGGVWYEVLRATDSSLSGPGTIGLSGFNTALSTYKDYGGGVYGAAAPIIEEIGQVSETDTVHAVTAEKQAAIGQSTETDTAQTHTSHKKLSIGQNTETDTAQAVTVKRTIAIGQASETDEAQTHTTKKSITIGQATETDIAQTHTSHKRTSISQTFETDEAQPVTAEKQVTIGQATETDVSQPVSTHYIAGHVTETDTAQPVTAEKQVTIGQASETDEAQAIALITKTKAIVQTSETDEAQPVSGEKTLEIDSVEETDEAQTHTSHKTLQIGQAEETDTAQPVTTPGDTTIEEEIVEATETDEAQPVTSHKTLAIGQVEEIDEAQVLTANKTLAINQAEEVDEATTVTVSRSVVIGQAEETDEVHSVTSHKTLAIGQAEEIDEPLSIVTPKFIEIGIAEETSEAHPVTTNYIAGVVIETDTAQPVTPVKELGIGQAEETDTVEEPFQNSIKSREILPVFEGATARPVTSHKAKVIGQAEDVEIGQIITPSKSDVIGTAEETDTAQTLSSYKVKVIGQAEEIDSALLITEAADQTNIYNPGLVTLNEDQFTNLDVLVNILGFSYDFNSESSVEEVINSLNFDSIEVSNNFAQPTVLNNFDSISHSKGIEAVTAILGIRLLGGLGLVPLNDDQYVSIDAIESARALLETINSLGVEGTENRINIDEPTYITRIVSVEKLNGIQYDIITRGLEEPASSLGVEAL